MEFPAARERGEVERGIGRGGCVECLEIERDRREGKRSGGGREEGRKGGREKGREGGEIFSVGADCQQKVHSLLSILHIHVAMLEGKW